jgi:hypothetical protein
VIGQVHDLPGRGGFARDFGEVLTLGKRHLGHPTIVPVDHRHARLLPSQPL